MTESNDIRTHVSKAYANAVEAPAPQTSGCCEVVPKGVAVKLAGYSKQELEALPNDAVTNSFGCGNPLAFSEVKEGEAVLDLGSGAGIDLLIAAKKVGPTGRVIGVDMTDEMIAKAQANLAAANAGNVEIRKGIIEELPVESESMDWVISNCVINLSPEKPKVFSEIARVLKPGGRMLVSDIVAEDLPEWIYENETFYNTCIAGAISETDYLSGLRDAGLTDVEVRERITYDPKQVEALVGSEITDTPNAFSCCTPAGDCGPIDQAVEAINGKIWSVKIFARKPG